ncbi:MAG: ABC transporter ATP-binding protein [Bacteroidota bacterium]|nr:ABC transporter ATP-binding protein [Bacteroidota bacterium]
MKIKFSKIFFPFIFYRQFVGKKIFILIFLSFCSGLLDSVGVTLLFPLFELMMSKGGQASATKASLVTEKISQLFSYLNVDYNIKNFIFFLLSVIAFKAIVKFSEQLYKINLVTELTKQIRYKVFDKIGKINYDYYVKLNTGSLTNLATTESFRVNSSFIYGAEAIMNLITAFSFLIYVFIINYQISLITILLGSIYFTIFYFPTIYIRRISTKISLGNALFTSMFIQSIQTFKYLKATRKYLTAKNIGLKYLDQVKFLQRKQSRANAGIKAFQEPFMIVIIFTIYLIEFYFFENSASLVLVILLLFYRCFGYIQSFQLSLVSMNNNSGSLIYYDNFMKEFDQNLEKYSALDIETLVPYQDKISVKDVSFSYQKDIPILKSLNFNINLFSTVAFVGSSGSGKSTLIDLISGLLVPQTGRINIDDVELKEANIPLWQNGIGYITQENVMYDDSIANNITMWKYGENGHNEERVVASLKEANAWEFVQNMPKGIQTPIGDRGVMLSGGQRQRLAIARELYKRPNLLILDEATSALDSESEKQVQNSIDLLKGKVTILIIAHRLSTVMNADCIFVLKEGEIVESGSFKDLTNNSHSTFYKMSQAQGIVS